MHIIGWGNRCPGRQLDIRGQLFSCKTVPRSILVTQGTLFAEITRSPGSAPSRVKLPESPISANLRVVGRSRGRSKVCRPMAYPPRLHKKLVFFSRTMYSTTLTYIETYSDPCLETCLCCVLPTSERNLLGSSLSSKTTREGTAERWLCVRTTCVCLLLSSRLSLTQSMTGSDRLPDPEHQPNTNQPGLVWCRPKSWRHYVHFI